MDNQLIAVRILINKSKQQIAKSGMERTFTLLHIHDALDWTMQYLYQSVEKSKTDKSFRTLIKYVSMKEDKFGAIDMVKAYELNDMRNVFKHSFVIPNDERLKFLSMWCEDQINIFLKKYKGTSLRDYDIVNTISIPDVSKEIYQAREEYKNNDKVKALYHLAVAFDIVTHSATNMIETISGDRPTISADFTFSKSFFMNINDLGSLIGKGHELAKSWDNIVSSIVHLNKSMLVDILGLELRDYYRFQSSIPRVNRMLNGEYHCDITAHLEDRMINIDYDFCENLVTQAAINVQSLINNETTV